MNIKKNIWYLILLALLIIYPFFVGFSNYYLTLAFTILMYIIASIGLNMLLGYGGLVSVGQAGFLSVGAYVVAIITKNMPLPFPITLLIAGIVAGLIGLIIGASAVRLQGHFLAIVTLGFGLAVPHIILNWDKITGGYSGMSVTKPTIVFNIHFYYIVILIVFLIIWLMTNIIKSNMGRSFMAMRDSEVAASSLGINVAKNKLILFVISSFITGIAGGLYAYWFGFVSPNDFTITISFLILSTVIIGGLGSIPGSIVGAFIISIIPHFTSQYVGVTNFAIGAILVIIILFLPKGIVSLPKKLFGSKGKRDLNATN